MNDDTKVTHSSAALPAVSLDSAESSYFGERTQSLTPSDFSDALDKLTLTGAMAEGLALNIHLPFCSVRCVSCDRIALVAGSGADIDDYLAGLEEELNQITRRIGQGNVLAQLHVGGGTPNLLTAAQLAKLMALVERHFIVTEHTETSIEIIPDRTSRTQLELIRGLGFRQLIVELRQIDPLAQQGLGRSYSPELLQDVIGNARAAAFETITMELMYGLPGQTPTSVKESVSLAADLAPDRVVTRPFVRRADEFTHQKALDVEALPTLAEKMAMFVGMSDGLERAGYVWIGINAYAKPSDRLSRAQEEGLLRRNRLGYCVEPARWLLGVGLGAVTELPTLVSRNRVALDSWHGALRTGHHPINLGVPLSRRDSAERDALNKLAVELRAPLDGFSNPRTKEVLARMEGAGYVVGSEGLIEITPLGRLNIQQVWDEIASAVRWAHVA